MKKVLMIFANLKLCNGVASYAMNYYRNIDRKNIKIDFAVFEDVSSVYKEEILKNGDKIHVMPSIKNLPNYLNKIKSIYSENNYDIVHCNITNLAPPYLYYAKKMGVKTRILHSHATKSSDVKWKEIRNNLITPLALKYSNTYYSCSILAGQYLFKNREFAVVNNALDLNRFYFDKEVRQKVRNEMSVDDKFIIGTVGRLVHQKNPFFALDVYKEVLKKDKNVKYLWIGAGPLEKEVKEYAKKIGIYNDMMFLGSRDDVTKLYQAIDVMLLPSKYEGLPVVGVEAQAVGLPLVLADTITTEMKIINEVDYLSLEENKEKWAVEILKYKNFERKDKRQEIINGGYEIKTQAKKLEKLYINNP